MEREPQLPERYVLDANALLGEGGMGRVLRARDRKLDIPVALKLVRPDLAADPRFRRMFDMEVRLSARFHHPHIVPLHDVGETPEGIPFLGLAFADGGNFAAFRGEPPPWPELLRLSLQLLAALGHLHARDVLHRDLKPENVLLHRGEQGQRHVWLADLGLAHAASSLVRTKGRTEGTPGFMAPEQRLGKPREYGGWTDLYALGVVLWEIVCGSLPFGPEGTALDGDLPPWTPRMDVPDGLATVLRNVLAVDPLARYDLAADLRSELLALGASVPSSAGADVGASTVAAAVASPFPGPVTRSSESAFSGVSWWNRPLPGNIPEHPPLAALSSGAQRASLALLTLREIELTARDAQREALWQLARQTVVSGAPVVGIVIGHAGSGRTRLVEDLAQNLEAGGWAQAITMRWTRPMGADDGYVGAAVGLLRPWKETREALRDRLARGLARERGVLDATVTDEADMLARWCGLGSETEPVPVGLGLRTVYAWAHSRGWRGLSLMVLDDVHDAVEQGDGLDIAESLLGTTLGAAPRPLLCVATIRSEAIAADATLAARVAGLVARGAVRIDVPPLEREGTLRLVEAALHLDPLLAGHVADRCEGNPLFARALLADWAGRGWLVDVGGLQWGLAPGVDVRSSVPPDAASVLVSRVDALIEASDSPRRLRDAVHQAALAGASLPLALLHDLLGSELESFVGTSGLWTLDPSRARFESVLLQEALTAAASARSDVAYLHRRLARSWARVQDASDPSDLDVGRHAVLGHDLALAVDALIRAADRAWRSGRVAELDEATRLALIATEAGSEAIRRGEVSLWRGRALQAAGRPASAGEAYRDAVVAFDSMRDGDEWFDASLGAAWSDLERGELDGAGERYDLVIPAARALGRARHEYGAIAGKGWLELQKRNLSGAGILFLRAANRAAAASDGRGEAEALVGAALVARQQGAFDEALEQYAEAAESLQNLGDRIGSGRARVGLAATLRQLQRVDDAERVLRESLTGADQMGALAAAMEARLGLAHVCRQRGAEAEARALYTLVIDWADRQGAFEAGVTARLGLAEVCLATGAETEAREHAREAGARLKPVPGHSLWAPYRLVVAEQLAVRKDMERCWQWLYAATELGLADTVDIDVANLLTRLAERGRILGWTSVTKHCTRLALAQWEALGDPLRIREITQS